MKTVTDEYVASMNQKIRNRSRCRTRIRTSDGTWLSQREGLERNNRLISVTINEYNSPIAEDLPQTDATIIWDNRDLYLDPTLATEPASLLKAGGDVWIYFGYDINGDGTYTYLTATRLKLASWQIGETEAQFTAVDAFTELVDLPRLNVGDQLTVYDYADTIFTALGVNYSIDGYESYQQDPGQDFKILNPVPYATPAELLQMLANAGHGYLYYDDAGVYHLAKAPVESASHSVTSSGHHALSGTYYNIMDDGIDRKAYTFTAYNFWQADGNAFFAPEDASDREGTAAWFSAGLSADPNGEGGDPFLYDADFAIEITFSEGIEASEVRVNTTHIYDSSTDFEPTLCVWLYSASDMENPTVLTVSQGDGENYFSAPNSYTDLKKIKVTNLDASGTNTAHAFNEYVRLGITSITLGAPANTEKIERSQMFSAPILSDENRIRSITVECDSWAVDSNNYSESGSVTIPASSTQTFTVEHQMAIESGNGVITGASGVTLDSVSVGGFATTFTVTNSNATATPITWQVYGTSLTSKRKSLTVTYDTTGRDLVWYNPLVNFSEAKKLADWIYSNYNGKFDMTFDWRGDPKIQAHDYANIEQVDGTYFHGRVVETELSFDGSISGRMTVRKAVT